MKNSYYGTIEINPIIDQSKIEFRQTQQKYILKMYKKSSLGLGTKIGAAANKPDLNVGCCFTKYAMNFKNSSSLFHKK